MSEHLARSDWEPLEPELHRRQLTGLMQLLPDDREALVLDLGCGAGRTLLPLAISGHYCIGVDNDPDALDACREAIDDAPPDIHVRLLHYNFVKSSKWPDEIREAGRFDLVMSLGHTWMLVVDPMLAIALAQRIKAILHPEHGHFVIDNFPADLWPHVSGGDWQSGVSNDRESQIVWAPNDNVFALREGASNVDLYRDNEFKDDDRLHRLWTIGELHLLAYAAGFVEPEVNDAGHLIVFGSTSGG